MIGADTSNADDIVANQSTDYLLVAKADRRVGTQPRSHAPFRGEYLLPFGKLSYKFSVIELLDPNRRYALCIETLTGRTDSLEDRVFAPLNWQRLLSKPCMYGQHSTGIRILSQIYQSDQDFLRRGVGREEGLRLLPPAL